MPRPKGVKNNKTHKTTINVPYDNWVELRLKCIDRHLYVSELLNEIIEDYLNSSEK